jgi:transposase
VIDELIVGAVFPQLRGVEVEDMRVEAGVLQLTARAVQEEGSCPACGAMSGRVHGSYDSRIADLPVGARPVQLTLRVRRFCCPNVECSRRTFSAQVQGLTGRYCRRSLGLQRMLEAVAVFLAGRAGARLAAHLAVTVSRSSMLRLLNAVPLPAVGTVSEVGIDDFAFRRGHRYGTLVIDMDSHHPVEVLPDRSSDTTSSWLAEHLGISLICRDRAGAYAEAARTGLPDAIQVADRWHLWHNLAEAVEKIVRRHRGDLETTLPDSEEPEGNQPTTERAGDQVVARPGLSHTEPVAADDGPPPIAPGRLVTRTIERHAAVHALLDAGRSLSAVSRELQLDLHTVRRFARAAHVEELLGRPRLRRDSVLDKFKAHLRRRSNEGITNAEVLTREITALGYQGSDKTVRRYLQPWRAAGLPAPPPVPTPPTVRQVTGWLTRRPEDVTESDSTVLQHLTARCPALATTHDLVREFAKMLTHRHGDRLGAWMERVDAEGQPELRAFAASLRRDLTAVTAGLTLPHSSGPVEGNVNRVKTIKRQMYGRAGFDLLRRRILLAA